MVQRHRPRTGFRPRPRTFSTPSTAGARPAAAWAWAFPAPPGSSEWPAAGCAGRHTRGQGTIFHINLPLPPPPEQVNHQPTSLIATDAQRRSPAQRAAGRASTGTGVTRVRHDSAECRGFSSAMWVLIHVTARFPGSSEVITGTTDLRLPQGRVLRAAGRTKTQNSRIWNENAQVVVLGNCNLAAEPS